MHILVVDEGINEGRENEVRDLLRQAGLEVVDVADPEEGERILAVVTGELRRAEQAERIGSLGRLASSLAHEFNNVLMGIAPFVDVIRRASTPEKVASAVDHIANSVKRGRHVTEDILRFTQPSVPVRTAVDIEPWLNTLALDTSSLIGTDCRIEVASEPLQVEADANQLHEIFMHLLLNARDAVGAEGQIMITAKKEPASARFAFGNVPNPDRFAHIIVADNGPGIPLERQAQVFEPLLNVRRSGRGLGLAVTYQLVRRHEGEIFIQSSPGNGTAIHVFLPLSRERSAIAEAAGERPRIAISA